MDTVCGAVFPVVAHSRAKSDEVAQSREVVQIECRQHWGILIMPACVLNAWLAGGFFFVSILTHIFDIFGQQTFTQAPQLIAAMFSGSSLLIGLLYWHSYQRSAIRLTSRKATFKTGPLFHGSGEMDLNRTKLVVAEQSALGRLFNYGGLSLVDYEGHRLRLRFIPKPREFHERLTALRTSNALEYCGNDLQNDSPNLSLVKR
jgi:hypothetical protein